MQMEKQMKKSLSRQMTAVFVGLLAFVLAAVFIVNAVFLGHYYTTHKESDLLNTYNALKEAQESDELTDENKQWKLSYELEKRVFFTIRLCGSFFQRIQGMRLF